MCANTGEEIKGWGLAPENFSEAHSLTYHKEPLCRIVHKLSSNGVGC